MFQKTLLPDQLTENIINMTTLLLGLQRLDEGIIFPFTNWVFAALSQGPLSHLWGALTVEADIVWLYQLRMSTHKWCQPSTEFVIWILNILLSQTVILLLPLPLFSSITDVAEVVIKLVLRSEPLHVLTIRGKVLRFTLCKWIYLSLLLSILCTYWRGLSYYSNASWAFSCRSSKYERWFS
jgi:hypothetical protein